MSRSYTPEECFAKAEAYQSCADHMELYWTDNPLERKAGELLSKALYARVEHWRNIGRMRNTSNTETADK